MAISALVTWEFNASATANMLNGGGFKTGASGTDYSRDLAAHLVIVDLESDAADNTKVFSTLTPFDVQDIGNILHINSSGSGFTQGWYEVTAVDGSSPPRATLDRTCGGLSLSGADARLGGALSLNSTLDYDFFGTTGPLVAGQRVYFKKGNYTLGESLITIKSGDSNLPIFFIGYNTVRDAACNGSDRPNISLGAYRFSFGNSNNIMRNFIFTGTEQYMVSVPQNGLIENVKSTQLTNNAGYFAINGTIGSQIFNCEAVAFAGIGITNGGSGGTIIGCYAHHCNVGIQSNGGIYAIANNVVANVATYGISVGTSNIPVFGNTVYGSTSQVSSIGIYISAGSLDTIFNNIVSGFNTGIYIASSDTRLYTDYNNIYNCGTAITNLTAGIHELEVDPLFVNGGGTLIHDCETTWSEYVGTGVTSSVDGAVYKVGTYSAKATCTAALGIERVMTVAISAQDMSAYHGIGCWVRSSATLAAGDWQLLLDNTPNCSSPIKRLNFPMMASNTWYLIYLDGGDMSGCTSIISVGLYQAVDKGAMSFYIDDVRGCNNDFSLQGSSDCIDAGLSYYKP
jgi:hypothetical protein